MTIEFTLTLGSLIGLVGLVRMLVSIYSHAWYARKWGKIDNLVPFDCSEFHKIQMEARPWGVRVNDWLVRHHV